MEYVDYVVGTDIIGQPIVIRHYLIIKQLS